MISPLNKSRQSQKKLMTEDDIPRLRHDFMCAYGWISKEEFEDIDMSEVLQLNKHIQDDHKAEREYRKSVLQGLGYKIK